MSIGCFVATLLTFTTPLDPFQFHTTSRRSNLHSPFRPVTKLSMAITRRTSRLIWHRGRDLRLHDNELYNFSDLHKQVHCHDDDATATTPVRTTSIFIFDKHHFHPQPSLIHPYQTIWCGPHAARATIEAVMDLRHQLRSIGGELLVRYGDPTVILPQIIQDLDITELVFCEEPGTYECQLSQKLRQLYTHHNYYDDLQFSSDYHDDGGGSGTRSIRVLNKAIYTLYHPNDLPFHPDEWNQLAHPKNHKKGKRKKKHGKSSSGGGGSPNGPTHDSIIDVSPERFRGMCRIMTDFRTAARSKAMVRPPLPPPVQVLPHAKVQDGTVEVGIIPTLEELVRPLQDMKDPPLGLNREIIHILIQSAIAGRDDHSNSDEAIVHHHHPIGERAGLKHLEDFLTKYAADADRSRADVSNNDSSRFSTHLAFGTLSPRMVYHRAKYHTEGGGGEGEKGCCKWLMSHLEMRDFFLFTAFATGIKLFQREGLPIGKKKKQDPIVWTDPGTSKHGLELWKRWASCDTQFPLIDAAMTELISTGYCSNRVRQNMASFLTKDLNIDWRMGAEWFQFLLEDHCVGANWGNWLYFSGVGPDPKNRHFRTISQSIRYDNDGAYVQKWLPALQRYGENSSGKGDYLEAMFRPWDHGVSGFDDPIIDPKTQLTWQDLQRLEESGSLIVEEDAKIETDF